MIQKPTTRPQVTIVDPHVKRDPGYYIFSEAEKAG
jgi:alpha 1,3-glucosidase